MSDTGNPTDVSRPEPEFFPLSPSAEHTAQEASVPAAAPHEPVIVDMSDDPRHKAQLMKLEQAQKDFEARTAAGEALESSKIDHAADLLAAMTGASKADALALVKLIRS